MDLYSSTKGASRPSSARVSSAALAGSEKSKAMKFNNRKARASDSLSRSHCARCFNRSQPASSAGAGGPDPVGADASLLLLELEGRVHVRGAQPIRRRRG